MTVRNTSRGKLKLPAHVFFRKDLSLMLWNPHGTLDEVIVNEIVAFIWEKIADSLSKAGSSWGRVSPINSNGRTIWIADAHRDDGKRFGCACG